MDTNRRPNCTPQLDGRDAVAEVKNDCSCTETLEEGNGGQEKEVATLAITNDINAGQVLLEADNGGQCGDNARAGLNSTGLGSHDIIVMESFDYRLMDNINLGENIVTPRKNSKKKK